MAVVTPCLVLQNSSHPADRHRQWMRYAHGNRGGVVQGGLVVTQNGTPNMSVNVSDGMCIVPGTENTYQGSYVVENQGTLNLVVGTSDPTNPRRDLIIARVRDAVYSGASNAPSIEVVQGAPAASPADPALPAGSCWVIARVAVGAAVSTISNANITRFAEGGTGYTGQNGAAAALGGIIPASSAFRPVSGLYEGMMTFDTDLDGVSYYDGASFLPLGPRGFQGAVSALNPTTSFASTGLSFTVPAGRWMFYGKTECAALVAAAATTDLRIQNTTDNTTLDQTEVFFGTGLADRRSITVMAAATHTTSKTIQLQTQNSVGGANYPLANIKFIIHASIF